MTREAEYGEDLILTGLALRHDNTAIDMTAANFAFIVEPTLGDSQKIIRYAGEAGVVLSANGSWSVTISYSEVLANLRPGINHYAIRIVDPVYGNTRIIEYGTVNLVDTAGKDVS